MRSAEGASPLRSLALAVFRQAVTDISFRPYRQRRHRCCPLPPEECAPRFLGNGQGELWGEVAGISAGAVRRRLTVRLSLS